MNIKVTSWSLKTANSASSTCPFGTIIEAMIRASLQVKAKIEIMYEMANVTATVKVIKIAHS